jgi:methionyl-tRNA synthetase
MSATPFYITTAIPYPNALPHIGTAYEMIGTDAIARFYRLAGYDVFFLTGTDEHSQNVEKAAREKGVDPSAFVDDIVPEFDRAWRLLGASYDDFIRTTSERHKHTVRALIQRCYDAGDIYKGTYDGFYCGSCEAYYTEEDLVQIDGDSCCPNHQRPVEYLKEENYFFALSKYTDRLKAHIEENRTFIQPDVRRNEVLGLIEQGLRDFSISRVAKKWGIPLPFDPSQVVYVWFDALTNYLSGLSPDEHDGPAFDPPTERYERYWPADVHVIGKDISRFHCLYWPAMLMSGGLPVPKQVSIHGWINAVSLDEDGAPHKWKMSKSVLAEHPELAPLIDPIVAAERHGPDALRYFLLREIAWDRDGNYMLEKFDERYNADLANDLGNLLNRVVSMIGKYCDGTVPKPAGTGVPSGDEGPDADLKKLAEQTVEKAWSLVQASALNQALTEIWALIQRGNQYVEETAPFKLRKDPARSERLGTVLYNLAETLRIVGLLVTPFMPTIGPKIWQQLGLGAAHAAARLDDIKAFGGLKPGTRVGPPVPLFPKEDA